MTDTYHYTESGLDDIYLANGFEIDGGKLRIHDIEGLHRAIGRWLLSTKKRLSGGEFRFLRHELEMSQATLASLLGVAERTVIRWESARKERNIRNPAAERTLRLLYLEKDFGKTAVLEALERIADLEDRIGQLGEFSYGNGNKWHENMAA